MNDENYQVKVPQMGEGLRFAKVVRILKNPGERVEEDDDVVEVETEKAILAISSPVSGVVAAVECRVGELADVGATLLTISASETRPAQIIFQQQRKGARMAAANAPAAKKLPPRQAALAQYMKASRDIVIPASIETRLDWEAVDVIKRACRASGGEVPSAAEIIAWAVSQSMQKFEKFRARLTTESELHITDPSLIGIAVAGEDDTLETRVARIDARDDLWSARAKMADALENPDGQAPAYHSVSISDMSSFQVISASPVVVYPAVATLFVGAPHYTIAERGKQKKCANLVLAFDHRVMNGVYAAKFLKAVNDCVKQQSEQMAPKNERAEEHEELLSRFGT